MRSDTLCIMKDITPTYINPFDSKDISLAKLIAFTSDNMERMSAQNTGGWLSDRIAATSTALSVLEDAYTENFTKLGFRKAQKKAKNAFRKNLTSEVAKIVGAVIAEYGEGSAPVDEVVPQGRTAFSNASDDLVENHIETMINGLAAHQADLGSDLVNHAEDLHTQWVAIYTASEQATGQKAATEADQRQARAALQMELFQTLLTLAKRFPNQPEQSRIYMQPHLLGYRRRSALPTTTPPAPVGGSTSGSTSVGSTGSTGGSSSIGSSSVGSTGSGSLSTSSSSQSSSSASSASTGSTSGSSSSV